MSVPSNSSTTYSSCTSCTGYSSSVIIVQAMQTAVTYSGKPQMYTPMKRPETDGPADQRVSAMLTVTEKEQLERLSDALGLSMSRCISEALARLTAQEKERLELIERLRDLDNKS